MEHSVPSNSPSAFLNNRYASSASKFLNNRYATSTSKFLNSRYASSAAKFLNSRYSSSPTKFLNNKYSSSPTKFQNSRYSSSPTKFLNSRYKPSPTKLLNRRYDSSPAKFLNSRYASSPSKFLKRDNIIDNQDNAVAPPAGLFFHQSEVRPGTTMKVSYPPTSLPPILPRAVAETVPFTNLNDVLTTFNITPHSADAATLNDTIQRCQASPNNDGKPKKACTMSLESTVQSAKAMLAGAGEVWAVASAIPRGGLPAQRYVVDEVAPLNGDRHVGCHDVPFPYAVYIYICHLTVSTKAYMMSLRGIDRGGTTTTVAIAALCHLDTKDWSPGHPAFEVLRTRPGGAPVCHFLPYANLLFGEKKVAEA